MPENTSNTVLKPIISIMKNQYFNRSVFLVFTSKCSYALKLSLLFVFVVSRLQAQQNNNSNLGTIDDHKKILDSLIRENYDQIKEAFLEHRSNREIANLYANAYLKKAKKEKDTIELANGYDILCKYNISNSELALLYVDSIIAITKNVKHEYYPSRGFLNKGVILSQMKRYDEALEHYVIAEKDSEMQEDEPDTREGDSGQSDAQVDITRQPQQSVDIDPDGNYIFQILCPSLRAK